MLLFAIYGKGFSTFLIEFKLVYSFFGLSVSSCQAEVFRQRGAVLNWIKSYLSNRSYQVQIDGVLSEEAPCLSGVPQGSVIGRLFFCYI